jgi:crotonobetainyl-CoA:carnitine CoA-transferase CaiB-like acyl-CoA transferase
LDEAPSAGCLMQAFDGIRVLDLTHVLAGPFSTYQLAILGADVIKIESPRNPDMVRAVGADPELNRQGMGADYQAQAANKRSLTLDLADPDGAAVFRQLVATADVVVDNYQAGSMERLGLDWEALRQVNPRLIYCSITGYGHTGPKAERPSYDATIKAASGFLAAQHRSQSAAEMVIGPPAFDYATGVMAAFAISTALLRRERTGEGQRLDVAMFDAALTLLTVDITNLLAAGEPADPTKWDRQGHPGYRLYETADGVLMAGAWTAAQTARFWEVIGDSARAVDTLARTIPEIEATTLDVIAEVQQVMLTRTADEWEQVLTDAQVPASRVRTLNEAIADPQVAHRGTLVSHESGLRHPLAAFVTDRDGPSVQSAPPEMGADTDQVLAEIGIDQEQRERLRARGVI